MKYGFYATFMPKPLYGENGSGMHVHQSLFKGGRNAFYDANDQFYLSDVAKSFIAGQLKHAREISALFAQWVNSYKRLVPGYEAPVYVAWSRRNRSALIRVPLYHPGKEQATRCEIRSPDPSCNPYLCFAALLQAGLEGIEKGYELPEPMERNLYHLSPDERKQLGHRAAAGDARRGDRDRGGVGADPEDARRARVHALRRDQAPGVGGLPHPALAVGAGQVPADPVGQGQRRSLAPGPMTCAHGARRSRACSRSRRCAQSDWPAVRDDLRGGHRDRPGDVRGAAAAWERVGPRPPARMPAGRAPRRARGRRGRRSSPVSTRHGVPRGGRGEPVRAPRTSAGPGCGRALGRGAGRGLRARPASGRSRAGSSRRTSASLALCESFGCRVVGVRERLGKMGDRWRDVVLVERRSPAV